MDQYERSEVTEETNAGQEKKRVPSRLLRLAGRVAALAVTIALILGAVYLVVNRDKISVDALRRMFAYRSVSTDEAGWADQIAYSGDASSSFASLEDGLLVCSRNQLQLFSHTGEQVLEVQVSLNQPILSVQGEYALAYDAGGSELCLIRGRELLRTYSAAKEQGLLSARVSENGWLTIVEQATGYKAAVTVYNADFQPVLTENISSSFITDAILSPDGKTLALVSIGEDSSGFDSVIIFYNLSDGEECGRCVLGNDVVLDLDWEADTLWVSSEYGAYCIRDNALAVSYTDSSRFLQGFSLGGDGFAALFFSKYQGGSTGSLTVLSADGTQHDISLSEEVRSVSAAGEYLAVLTSSSLTIYRTDLSVYTSVEDTAGARRVLMRSDGSAMLISTESASLYLPN